MSRYDQLKQQHEKKSHNLGMTGNRKERGGSQGTRRVIIRVAPGVIILAVLCLGALLWYWQTTDQDSDAALAEAADTYRQAVGLIVVDIREQESGREITVPVATAWSREPGIAATNAHVGLQLLAFAEHGGEARIVVNGRPDLQLEITEVKLHENYLPPINLDDTDVEETKDAGFAYDVALLEHEGEFPVHFPVADDGELDRLGSGYRIAYLGFPMENLFRGNVNVNSPVATMQTGIITAVTNFQQRDARAEDNYLIRHNLAVTGGASGSPLFNTEGKVVGIVNGMNMSAQSMLTRDGEKVMMRTPSAAMINFAQRIDLLEGVINQGFELEPRSSESFMIDRQ